MTGEKTGKQTARMSLDIKIPLDLRAESGITFNM